MYRPLCKHPLPFLVLYLPDNCFRSDKIYKNRRDSYRQFHQHFSRAFLCRTFLYFFQEYWRKKCSYNVGEIDTLSTFIKLKITFIKDLPLKKFSVSVSWVPIIEVVSPQIMRRTRTPSSAFFFSNSPTVKLERSSSFWLFNKRQSSILEQRVQHLIC
jgi:hypothetical protein